MRVAYACVVLAFVSLGGCITFLTNYSDRDGGPPAAAYGAEVFVWSWVAIGALLFASLLWTLWKWVMSNAK
jgi:hypothetical protein